MFILNNNLEFTHYLMGHFEKSVITIVTQYTCLMARYQMSVTVWGFKLL